MENTQIIKGINQLDDIQVKLNTIQNGAEINVQSDWSETDTTKDSFIKNKPNILGVNNGDETTESIKIKLGTASSTQDGYLKSIDWDNFNNKQNAIYIQDTEPVNSNSKDLWIDTLLTPYILKLQKGGDWKDVGAIGDSSLVAQSNAPTDTSKLWLDNTVLSNPMLKWNNGATWVIIGGSGSSVAQVQSDWNQTDNTKSDFIKNKPIIPMNTWAVFNL